MKEKIEAAVWGSFIADALALGVHWVYNTRVIDKKFGRVDGYQDPLTSYHKGKKGWVNRPISGTRCWFCWNP
jgi:ADP-ribosylglycohydrolase